MNPKRLVHLLSKTGVALPIDAQKRNGSVVRFDSTRIEQAISKCYAELGTTPVIGLDDLVIRVATAVGARYSHTIPTVEEIQDLVEITLLSAGEIDAARAYIAYRGRQNDKRDTFVPDDVRAAFETDKQHFKTPLQQFVFYDKYSRFDWDKGRRETWTETVDRTVDHLRWEVDQHKPGAVPESVFARIHNGILKMQIMPSMRLLAMAGEAARRNSMSLYNCSYLPVHDIQSFVEGMLISMAGCGVGYSVERDYVEKFPRIKRQRGVHLGMHVIVDSTEGWADAVRIGLEAWWAGEDIDFDDSLIRRAGAVLRIKGGRASGPEPLMTLLSMLRQIVFSRQGSYLRTIDAHLMMCWIGEAAVQGGVRRTAMIALFDWDDHEMRVVKDGQTPALALTPTGSNVLWNANNSAVWPDSISDIDIAQQMLDMAKARSGEPGIFSRHNAIKTKPKRRKTARFGTNPCGEIILRPYGLCNLSQAIARVDDTKDALRDKVELATIVGVIQSLSTRFPGLRPEWKQNCEEERLLGVDLTAQVDCPLLREDTREGAELRRMLREFSVEVSDYWANELGINAPVSNTTNKPAGNSAEFVNGGNGIHRHKARRARRRAEVGTTSPIFQIYRDFNVPMEPKYGSTIANATRWIASFPKAAPDGALTIANTSAIDQLNFWLLNKENWTEHNPSCTITYGDNEIIDVIKWVCGHKERIGGLSFFPSSDAIYKQAPFEEVTDEEYEQMVADFPDVDYALLYVYEKEDMTTAAQELACFAGDGSCAM